MPSRAAAVIVTALEALGVRLFVQDGVLQYDRPEVAPAGGLDAVAYEARFEQLLAALRGHKAEARELIDARATGRPYLVGDCLVIPFAAPERYHWWAAEQEDRALHAILAEVHAGQQVHLAYCGVGCERHDNPQAQAMDGDDTVEAEQEHDRSSEREGEHVAGGASDG